jgi:hypothetical protein
MCSFRGRDPAAKCDRRQAHCRQGSSIRPQGGENRVAHWIECCRDCGCALKAKGAEPKPRARIALYGRGSDPVGRTTQGVHLNLRSEQNGTALGQAWCHRGSITGPSWHLPVTESVVLPPDQKRSANSKRRPEGNAIARQTKSGSAVHRLRFSHEAGGD